MEENSKTEGNMNDVVLCSLNEAEQENSRVLVNEETQPLASQHTPPNPQTESAKLNRSCRRSKSVKNPPVSASSEQKEGSFSEKTKFPSLKSCSASLDKKSKEGRERKDSPNENLNRRGLQEERVEEMKTTPAEMISVERKPRSGKSASAASKKTSKRKRSLFLETLDSESKAARINAFQQEICSLYNYFEESFKIGVSEKVEESIGLRNSPTNVIIARLLEESRLSCSKLVHQIHEKLKNKAEQLGGVEVTHAFIKSSVLLIAQRPFYGVLKEGVDVLEDESESCLWCWEVKDLKLLPKGERELVAIRRKCRRKIHERIASLSAMTYALSSEPGSISAISLSKAEEMLTKTDDEMSIKAMVVGWLQKFQVDRTAQEAKLRAKKALKEKERNERKNELEHKRMERELKREKLLQEKEQARALKEAMMQEKERKRHEEDAQKEQKKREQGEAEKRKQIALQKQANLMDRFLQSKKDDTSTKNIHQASQICSGKKPQFCITNMDQILQKSTQKETYELMSLHLESWRSHSRNCTSCLRWGIRRKPKVTLFSKLRLQGSSANGESAKEETNASKKRPLSDADDSDSISKDFVPDLEKVLGDHFSESTGNVTGHKYIRLGNKNMKLLQFDKSYRPAYYGTFSKTSEVIGPRRPFARDLFLDYDVDSDEEWEEEDPGESLSECDEEEEEEKLDNEGLKNEDDDSDGFLVPDGYLSEDEGVGDFESDGDHPPEEHSSVIVPQNSSKNVHRETESEWHSFQRKQRVLEKATEHALQSNRVFIVSNLLKDRNMRDNNGETRLPEANSREKLEQICLQALFIRVSFPDMSIDLPDSALAEQKTPEEQEPLLKRQKKSKAAIQDSDIVELASIIQSSTQGLNRIVDSLPERFCSIPKKRIKSKIREIADFVNNRWQVKSEFAESINKPLEPDSKIATPVSRKNPKGISAFFSKRCLPPHANSQVNVQKLSDSNNSPESKKTSQEKKEHKLEPMQ